MKMELAQVVNKGMQRDYAMNTASQEFAYENKNIRITSTGNESFLSVTNEKSTTPISLVFKDPIYRNTDLETELNDSNLFNDNYQLCIVNVNKATKTRLHLQGTFFGENGIGIRHHNEIYEIDVDKSVYDEEHYLNLTKIDITEQRQDLKNKIVSLYGVDRDAISINKGYLTIIEGYSGIYDSYDDVKDAQKNLEILSCTTCNNYLVLFTSYKNISNIHNIYRCEINLNYNAAYLNLVYTGNLNLQKDKPLECISYYESEDVQKLYWVDGINQPRVINIMELGQTSNTSNLDFVPKIEKQPIVTIEKEQNGAGLFPSGVVQYYITYYKKFNQETHTAYTSPLYYISPNDRGGEADSIQTCSFRIRITDVDPKYDYIRVYSLVRTSKNSDYVVSIVGDVNIKNSEDTYQIIDTNTNLINVPSSDILFLGGNVIIPSTIEQKDNTLFLGNITVGTNTISDEITSLKEAFTTIRENNELSNLLKFVYKVVPVKNEDNTTLYPYNPNLESNLYDTHFKLREKYRVGIQLINDVGEGTQTIYVGDIINENHYPHYMSQDVMNDFSINYENPIKVDNYYIDESGNIHLYDIFGDKSNYSDYLCLPIITFDFNSSFETIISNLKKKGFTNYKLVIAETDYKDRSILCQGYVNPLSFRLDRRKTNDCYNQESWTIRPIGKYKHLENVNKCKEDSDGSFNYTKDSEIRSSLDKDHYKQNCIINVKDTKGDLINKIKLEYVMDIFNMSVSFDYFLLNLYITVIGKDSSNNEKSCSWNLKVGSDWGISYYEFDDVVTVLNRDFPSFDVWTSERLNLLKRTFGDKLTDEVLRTYGFIEGARIFGDSFIITADRLKEVFDENDTWITDVIGVIAKEDTLNYYFSLNDDPSQDISGNHGENFYLDASKCSLNTPDLENISDILNSTPNLKCRIVGKIDIDRITSDQYLDVDNLGKGKIYNFNYSKILTKEDDYFGIKSFIGVQSGDDKKAYKLMMLDKDDSIDNTKNLILKNKRIGNLWYASKTDYEFHWRYFRNAPYSWDNETEYYPNKDVDYKNVTDATYTGADSITYPIYDRNPTYEISNWGWYSGLIYHDIELKNKGIQLWNKDLYINNETTLKNIEDNTYNQNWSLLRTNEGVGSLYYKDKLESLINYNDNTIESQNQIQIKYNTSDSILLDLQTYNSDLHFLPGYTNYELKGDLKPLWVNTPLVSVNTVIDYLEVDVDNIEDPIIILFDKSSIFYIKKECINLEYVKEGKLIENNKYYIVINNDELNFNYYNCKIAKLQSFTNDSIKNSEGTITKKVLPDDYYKFELSIVGDSYTYYNYEEDIYLEENSDGLHPLYNANTLNKIDNNYQIHNDKYFGLDLDTSGIDSNRPEYLFNLKSTLRGNYFLYEKYQYRTYGIGFVPNNNFKHYLPFNLKGKAGFDYPSYVTEFDYDSRKTTISEHNGINNSLWVCELYKDFDDFEFLGGTSENAIELNTFIPASQVCPIGSTIYGLYGDTYFKRWDNLRVYPMNEEQTNGIVDVVSLMLETHVNLDGDTRSVRKRLDITNMRPSNMEGLVNPVYSQSNNVITSNVLDDKFNVSSHPLQYWWSLPKTNLSEIDNWTHVVLTRVGELDGDKGPLNKIKRWNNYLFAFQDKGIAQINFNNQTVIGGQEGIPVEIANSGNVQGHYYITTNNGCKNKWSIVESPAGLYFIDSYNKSIMLLGDGLKSLSQLNLFQDWIEKNEHGNIWNPIRVSNKHAFKSFYDPIHSEVYFANGEHCLCYNELLQQFTSFYDYESLNYMFLLDGHIYGINYRYSSSDPIQLHKMFEGEDYCNLFGKQCEYYMQYKINKDPFVDKTWTNLEYRADIFNTGNIQSNKDYASDNIISNETFDALKVWNEYQRGELDLNTVRMNYLKDAKSRFRVWRTNIPRASKSETNKYGLDRIRNPWIMLELKKTGDTSKRMEFHDLVIKYVI